MFIKVGKSFLSVDSIALVEGDMIDGTNVVIAWLKQSIGNSNTIILCTGTQERCQTYKNELERELDAFEKLIRVEVD